MSVAANGRPLIAISCTRGAGPSLSAALISLRGSGPSAIPYLYEEGPLFPDLLEPEPVLSNNLKLIVSPRQIGAIGPTPWKVCRRDERESR